MYICVLNDRRIKNYAIFFGLFQSLFASYLWKCIGRGSVATATRLLSKYHVPLYMTLTQMGRGRVN